MSLIVQQILLNVTLAAYLFSKKIVPFELGPSEFSQLKYYVDLFFIFYFFPSPPLHITLSSNLEKMVINILFVLCFMANK